MKKAFTLAETLITLGIIGIILAITLPTVITTYQKEKTISYVKKFYNEINNAIRLSVVQNGDVDLWMPKQQDNTYQENVEFLENYVFPYIRYDHYEKCQTTRVCVYLSYGMFSFRVDSNGGDISFFANKKQVFTPKNYFAFQFNKGVNGKGVVEPYIYAWNKEDYNSLKNASWGGCNSNAYDAKYAYCTKWIEMNNWKVPKDYPWNNQN